MNPQQKQIFLKNLREYTDDQIATYVFSGDVQLSEIQEQVLSSRFTEIERIYNKVIDEVYIKNVDELKIKISNPNDAFFREINSEYLTHLVNTNAIKKEHIQVLLDAKEQRINREFLLKNKEQKLRDIEAVHPDYTISRVKELINNKEIDIMDLEKIGFDENDIHKIFNYYGGRRDNQDDWYNIMPLRDKSTDIYMMGRPGSGKSTTLAGVLYEANFSSRYTPDVTNIAGTHYSADLIQRISMGLLPEKTGDHINYISADLRNNVGGQHRVNFIEMSGERFDEIYNGAAADDTKKFLQNNNRKFIYFVIDYVIDRFQREVNLNALQSFKLMFVLRLFKEWGILKHTDAVFIVLNKSDLLLKQHESLSQNYEILKNRCLDYSQKGLYSAFYYLCKEYETEFKFHFDVLPGSVGKFKLADLYFYDPKASFEILRSIVNNSSYEKKKSFFGF